ncbi:hypothetical protein I4U23_015283 [Adineta vaga]|nr:hypothetical protein I4U23_015283 [Adineta vaga]
MPSNKMNVDQRIIRISDIAEESGDFLMPISGYEDMPLVPLDIAVEPLISLLPMIQSYAYAAKERVILSMS